MINSKLNKQFKEAINEKNENASITYLSELFDWLESRNTDKLKYKKFLTEMGLDIESVETAEVGKNKIDTLTEKYSNTTIITRDNKAFQKSDNRNIIIGEFNLYNEIPIVHIEDEKKIIFLNEINTFITHNPYSYGDIKFWDKLFNTYKVNVGVFGKNYDNDKLSKLDELFLLKSSIEGKLIKDEYVTYGDTYIYNIISKDQKKKTLTKRK